MYACTYVYIYITANLPVYYVSYLLNQLYCTTYLLPLCVCVCAKNTNRAREKHDTNAQANHLCDLHVIVRSLSQLDDFVYDGSGNERAQVVFFCFCANRQRQ